MFNWRENSIIDDKNQQVEPITAAVWHYASDHSMDLRPVCIVMGGRCIDVVGIYRLGNGN